MQNRTRQELPGVPSWGRVRGEPGHLHNRAPEGAGTSREGTVLTESARGGSHWLRLKRKDTNRANSLLTREASNWLLGTSALAESVLRGNRGNTEDTEVHEYNADAHQQGCCRGLSMAADFLPTTLSKNTSFTCFHPSVTRATDVVQRRRSCGDLTAGWFVPHGCKMPRADGSRFSSQPTRRFAAHGVINLRSRPVFLLSLHPHVWRYEDVVCDIIQVLLVAALPQMFLTNSQHSFGGNVSIKQGAWLTRSLQLTFTRNSHTFFLSVSILNL